MRSLKATFTKKHLISLTVVMGLLTNATYAGISQYKKIGFTMLPYRTLYVDLVKNSDPKVYQLINPLVEQLGKSDPGLYPTGAKPVVLTSGLDYSLSQGARTKVVPDFSTIRKLPDLTNVPNFKWNFNPADVSPVAELTLTANNSQLGYSHYGNDQITSTTWW